MLRFLSPRRREPHERELRTSSQAQGASHVGHVPLPIQIARLGVAADVCLRLLEPVHRRGGIYCLHEHVCQVSVLRWHRLERFYYIRHRHRSLHHTGEATNSGEVPVDPAAVVVSSGATSGLAGYTHPSQDYARSGREVYHAQGLGDNQGRPNSNQTMYNPSAASAAQYEAAPAQPVEGPQMSRMPSAGSNKQTPSPTTSGYAFYDPWFFSKKPFIHILSIGTLHGLDTQQLQGTPLTKESVLHVRQVFSFLHFSHKFHYINERLFTGGSSGPTYTQLGNSGPAGRAGYHQTSGTKRLFAFRCCAKIIRLPAVGMWHWQSPVVPPSESSPSNGGPNAAATVAAGVPATSAAGHAPQGSELVTDMLQMLDHSGTSGFEDLNMFSSNFE